MGLAWPSEFPGVVTQRFGPVDLDKEPRGFFESDGVGVLRALKSTFPNSERRDHVHLGLDVRAREGTKLFAAEAGEIVNADMFANGELFIQVRIQPGVVLHYGHCSSFVSNVGDQVARGQLIARAGHTGITTGTSANPASGAHLHIEVRITEVGTDGVSREMRYNPARFFAELGGDLVNDPRISPTGGLDPMIDAQRGNSYVFEAIVKGGTVLRKQPSNAAEAFTTLPGSDTPLAFVGSPGPDWRAVAFFTPAASVGLTGSDVQTIVYVPTTSVVEFRLRGRLRRGRRGRGG